MSVYGSRRVMIELIFAGDRGCANVYYLLKAYLSSRRLIDEPGVTKRSLCTNAMMHIKIELNKGQVVWNVGNRESSTGTLGFDAAHDVHY